MDSLDVALLALARALARDGEITMGLHWQNLPGRAVKA